MVIDVAIHPIDYRYGTAEMKHVWSQENRLTKILQTEAALARAEADMGLIPADAAEIIFESISSVKTERVDEIEAEIHHDMMAVVVAISEQCRDDAGKWVHFGATSNDILDTATALQIKDAIDILEDKLKTLLKILVNQAEAHKHTGLLRKDSWTDRSSNNLWTAFCYLGVGDFKASGSPVSTYSESDGRANDRSGRDSGCVWKSRNSYPETYHAASWNWGCGCFQPDHSEG